jgi:acyl-CoA dehydrogenase
MAAGYTPGHRRHPGEVTMAQLLTQRASFELMDVCLQIPRRRLHGEYSIERAARDARLGPIGGGSDERCKRSTDRVTLH